MGHPVTLFQYSVLISSLAKRAKSIVRDLDPTNELRYLRIRSRKHEVSDVRSISSSELMNQFPWLEVLNHNSKWLNIIIRYWSPPITTTS